MTNDLLPAPAGGEFLLYQTEDGRARIQVRFEDGKGFALDDERLKEPAGGTYFGELLARIRDIRSSERVFWPKVLENGGVGVAS